MPMSDADLEAIRQRAERATEGPWVEVCGDDECCSVVSGVLAEAELRRVQAEHKGRGYFPEDTQWIAVDPGVAAVRIAGDDNFDFIAAARKDIPALLAEIARLRKEAASCPT